VLIDGPGKFIIELPGNEGHDNGEESDNTWNGEQVWMHVIPDICFLVHVVQTLQGMDCLVDLIVLNGSIDKHAKIIDAKPDDLDGIFKSQGVVDEYQLVEKPEDKECKVCRDGFHVWYGRNVWP